MPLEINYLRKKGKMKYINSHKLENLKLNKDNTYIVIDFDRTITTKESNDSWSVSGHLLGKKFEKEINEAYKKYRPIEIDYKIPRNEKEEAMNTWYTQCMDLYYKYELTKEKLIKSVKTGGLMYRKGAKEFLRKISKRKNTSYNFICWNWKCD